MTPELWPEQLVGLNELPTAHIGKGTGAAYLERKIMTLVLEKLSLKCLLDIRMETYSSQLNIRALNSEEWSGLEAQTEELPAQ